MNMLIQCNMEVPNLIKQINNYYLISEAIHPKLGVIRLGDKVMLNDDHIIYGSNKNYSMTITTMFMCEGREQVYITDKVHKDSEFRRSHWASRPMGNYLQEIVMVVDSKIQKEIDKARQILHKYNVTL